MLFKVGEFLSIAGGVGFWVVAQAAPAQPNNYGAYGIASSVTAGVLVGLDWYSKRRKALLEGREQKSYYDKFIARYEEDRKSLKADHDATVVRLRAEHAQHVGDLTDRFRDDSAELRRQLTNCRREKKDLEEQVSSLLRKERSP
jgi:hypothetical protein